MNLYPHSKTFQLVFDDNTLQVEKTVDDTFIWKLTSHPAYSVTFTKVQLELMIEFLTNVKEAA